jgi:hypothetical protein
MPIILVIHEGEIRRIEIQSQPKHIFLRPCLENKYSTQDKAGGVAQVVEHLPSK